MEWREDIAEQRRFGDFIAELWGQCRDFADDVRAGSVLADSALRRGASAALSTDLSARNGVVRGQIVDGASASVSVSQSMDRIGLGDGGHAGRA